MAFDLGAARSRTRKVQGTFEGQTLNLEYWPHCYSVSEQADFEQQLNDESRSVKQRLESLGEYLEKVLVCWDVILDDMPLEISKAVIQTLPFDFAMFLFELLGKDKAKK